MAGESAHTKHHFEKESSLLRCPGLDNYTIKPRSKLHEKYLLN